MLRWLARDAEQRNAKPDFYSRSAWLAQYYVSLEDKEKTIACLEKAYQEHDPWLPMDLASPVFDPLRSDTRFQNLVRRIGLPE